MPVNIERVKTLLADLATGRGCSCLSGPERGRALLKHVAMSASDPAMAADEINSA